MGVKILMLTSIDHINTVNLFDFGGKLVGLVWLKSNGYWVPDFKAISNSTINEFLKKAEINSIKDFKNQRSVLKHLLLEEIQKIEPENWQNVAIRSSALDEDGSEDSFAGIHESVLNVNGAVDAAEALVKVIESFYSEIALSYRVHRSSSFAELSPVEQSPDDGNHEIFFRRLIRPAIIVQKMVQPRFSGVAFTNHPMKSVVSESVWISATSGLGDQLVSGLVSGEEYLFEAGKIKKLKESSLEIPESLLKELSTLCLDLERKLNGSQDVEWAYDGERLWILQVRPITTVWDNKTDSVTVFDNSNIQESYCGVTTPLTFTFASVCYHLVYTQLMKFMLMSDDEIAKAQWNLKNMLGLVNGRVYYNINNWYAGLLYLPSFGKRKKEMEEMMGLESPVDFVHGHNLTLSQKLLRLPKMIKLVAVMLMRFVRISKLVDDFDTWFWRLYKSAEIDKIHLLNEVEIFEKIKFYQEQFLEKWSIPVLNDTKVMMDMGKVKRVLNKYGFEGELKSIIAGTEIESLKPTLEIHQLSKDFSSDPAIAQILFTQSAPQLLKTLEIFHPSLCFKVKNYISLYGDRCMGELKLETITMRQDPEILFNIIRQYIENGLHLKTEIVRTTENHDVLLSPFAEIIKNMSLWDRMMLKPRVKAVKTSISAREKMRLHRTRNFGLMRELYLALGIKWTQRGLLQTKRDIFYLTHQEIFDIGSGKMVTASTKELISLRHLDFEKYQNMKTPGQVKLSFPPTSPFTLSANINLPSDSLQSTNIWNGLPAAQGFCEGEIVLVTELTKVPNVSGKILLAERTDPGWTPLFALVKGVIVEKGSMLSHSAIIAREMGIPSVIAIPQITSLLSTGDRVRLDGKNGTIEKLSDEQRSVKNSTVGASDRTQPPEARGSSALYPS